MSRPSVAPYHHGNLAEVLEGAALELLESRSAAELSLREVARRAGVSHNAPYHHFGDRQQLLKRVAERAMRELLSAQEVAVTEMEDPRERLLAMAGAYVDHAVSHPHAFAVIFDPDICVPGQPTEAMAPLIAANEELLAELAGALWSDLGGGALEARCAAVWGMVHGLATLVVAGHLPAEVVPEALEGMVGPVPRRLPG